MKLNDSRDILGFVILLLPYFDFSVRETCLKIKSLDDIFKDPNPNEKLYIQNVFKSTYYLDHDTVNYNLDDYKKYFYNNSQKIINTISKVKHKLLPNWLNIFPYKLKQISEKGKQTIAEWAGFDIFVNIFMIYPLSNSLFIILIFDLIGFAI